MKNDTLQIENLDTDSDGTANKAYTTFYKTTEFSGDYKLPINRTFCRDRISTIRDQSDNSDTTQNTNALIKVLSINQYSRNNEAIRIETCPDACNDDAEKEFLYNTNIQNDHKAVKPVKKKTGFEVRQDLFEKIKEMNLNISKQKVDVKEKCECSFKPKLNVSAFSLRSADEFFDDQIKYTEKASEKVRSINIMLQLKENNELTHRPKINSTIIPKCPKKKDPSLNNSSETHNPMINESSRNMVRNESVDSILYKDALRRQSSSKRLSMKKANQTFILDTSKFYLIKCIEEELDAAYKSICKENHIISKENAKIIITRLGFYTSESELLEDCLLYTSPSPRDS